MTEPRAYFSTALDGIVGPVQDAQALSRTVICRLVLDDGRVVTGSAQSGDRALARDMALEAARSQVAA